MSEEPDLKLAGLSIWVLDREFPDADDYWDGNWLNVHARVEAAGANVEVQGPIIHARELASFAEQLEQLDRTVVGRAALECMEPNLGVMIEGDKQGHVTATIKITPDHLAQSHEFIFSIDQTYLKPVAAQCRRILLTYPIKGTPGQ